MSKSKTFTDDNCNVSQTIDIVFVSVENIVGKGENALIFFIKMPALMGEGGFHFSEITCILYFV